MNQPFVVCEPSEFDTLQDVSIAQHGFYSTSGKMHLILHPFVTFATFANFFVQFCTI